MKDYLHMKLQLFRDLSLAVSILAASLCAASAHAQDILLSDFEQSTYVWLPTGESWTATGTTFGSGPATGPSGVTGYLGSRLVKSDGNSYGALTSPSFTITRKYIRFLIGAGNWRPQTTVNLIVDGAIVRKAVGMGDREHLDWLQWNVSGLLNKTAQIQIVDNVGSNESGDWKHLNVDQIIATDVSLSSVIIPDKKYLLLPVKTGATKRMIELVQEGLVVREKNVELSTAPDYWVFIDITEYAAQELVVRLDSKLATSIELTDFFVQSDAITTTTPIYQETIRPIYHYTAKRGFISDPNDLVYKNGEYHLGYQHNEVGTAWDNMTHGHAVSTDLVRWTELPESIVETYWGGGWNGSSVVDVNNTAGFGAGAIVSIYTAAAGWADNPRMSARNKFSQALAYSTDNGRTFKFYEGNPVLPNVYGSNHDPTVFWYAPGNHWVMVLFVGDNGGYHIYNSTDLKHWVFKSTVNISQTTEVPDLFPLPVDGDPNNVKWVFSCGYRQYIVGTFNGSTFTQEHGPFWYGWQKWDLAAALTYNNTPDGQRIMMTNGRTDYPGMPFNRYLNLPNVLTLKTIAGVPKLHFNPVAEVSNLRTSTQTWGAQTLNTGVNLMNGLSGEGVEIEIVFKPTGRAQMDFSVGEFMLSYNNGQGGKIGAGGQWRSLQPMADGNVHIRAFYDRGSWEVYANGGQFYMPMVLTPKAGTWPLTLTTRNDKIDIVSLNLHHMGSCWSSGGGNASPTVSISSPANGATFASGSSVTVAANAADSDGSISKVEFFANGSSIGVDSSSPYSADWTIETGSYSLTAVATDNAGATTTSSVVSVTGTSGTASSIYVASILTGTINAGGGYKQGSATITINDNLGNPAPNVTVTGTFSGSFSETKSGITGSNGSVTLVTTAKLKGSLTVNFCVTDVTHSSLTYNSSANAITCTGGGSTTAMSMGAMMEVLVEEGVQVFPNPFYDKLDVRVNLSKESYVHCLVFDSKGSLVAVLHADRLPAGTHYLKCKNSINGRGPYIIKTIVDKRVFTVKTLGAK